MLFTALAVAGFVVLPVHASQEPLWEIDWLGNCGPVLDTHKKCAPDTITGVPVYWLCKGEQRIWEPTEDQCTFDDFEDDDDLEDDEHATPDGDWHIGCDEPGHCGYYLDDSHKRSISSNPDAAARPTPAGPSPRKSPDWLNIPDWDHIDTRCSLTSIELVEKFNGQNWAHHYKCPPGTSCTDILGSGACRAGLQEFTIPGRSYLWPFECPGALKDPSTCHFSEKMNSIDYPKPHEPYLTGTTRCSPNGRAVQYLDGDTWTDVYACKAEAACVENEGQGGCRPDQDPLKPVVQDQYNEDDHALPPVNKAAQAEVPVQTRCEPLDETSEFVQYLDPTAQQWLRFYACGGPCFQFPEYAACKEYTYKFVIPYPLTESISKRDTPQNLNTHRLPRQAPQNPKAPDFHTIDTRCNPLDLDEVQRYNGTHWVHHFQCTFPGSCIDVDGHGACRLSDTVYELPSANRTSIKQGEGVNPLRPQTRCIKSNVSEVLEWEGHSWEPVGVCLPPYECFDFGGGADYALCVHPDAQYRRMWLPWPALSRSTNSGQVTRCKDQKTLEQFKDNVWVPYRR
ncbi:hypothetical protein P171DRAFT_200559 [Karstenula rhodostoma CBS 690.94]|uniref:Uncharacterized protein n=1 Tax=Karstenula rhodostoma CBS 690.94 TaxID=1392251 RepID=A0A9P4PTD5_9PLEO|nr:hypothetical protein P171DRAFT_200559 [Karstenula rhodostoma CBS 690.94]